MLPKINLLEIIQKSVEIVSFHRHVNLAKTIILNVLNVSQRQDYQNNKINKFIVKNVEVNQTQILGVLIVMIIIKFVHNVRKAKD